MVHGRICCIHLRYHALSRSDRACTYPLGCMCTGYIGEFEYVDDHRGGKIVVELNGRCACAALFVQSDRGGRDAGGRWHEETHQTRAHTKHPSQLQTCMPAVLRTPLLNGKSRLVLDFLSKQCASAHTHTHTHTHTSLHQLGSFGAHSTLAWLQHEVIACICLQLSRSEGVWAFLADFHNGHSLPTCRLNKCGCISPRYDISHHEVEEWVGRLLPSRLVSDTAKFLTKFPLMQCCALVLLHM